MINSFLDKNLHKVNKPARYIGGELHQVHKENPTINMALAFPDIYEIGESNLGLKILYDILNKEPDTFCQRVYAPDKDMKALMEEERIPLWTLEEKTPIKDLDIIGFAMAYELCYTTLLAMLKLGNIPLYSKDRNNNHPIIIAGGHCAFNPAPMSPFIDAFCIGDGEDIIINIKNAYLANKGNRSNILKAISLCDSVYVPSIHKDQIITAAKVNDFNSASFPTNPIVPHISVVHNRVMLEIMRGCTRGCRFCQAGMVTRPLRERDKDTLLKQAETLINSTGYEEIALTSLSSTDYSLIKPLIEDLTEAYLDNKVGISLPSIRADVDCVEMAHSISKIRKSGLTFAPEAGSQRLRDVINKNLTEDDLLSAVKSAIECGWKTIKLYFMIGLPYETDDDIIGIGKLIEKVMSLSKSLKAGLTLRVTISPFVPKPHTPFQWRPMDTKENLERKIKLLRENVWNKAVQISWHNPETSNLEAALARGDEKIGDLIFYAAKNGAYLEQDSYSSDIWEKASELSNTDINQYAYRSFNYQDKLPWDNISAGVSKKFLINEDKKAQEAVTTPSCRYASCSGCGIKKIFNICPPIQGKNNDYKIKVKAQQKGPNTGTAIFTFSKKNNLKFIGHLDLMAIFERAVRISGVPVWYSEGFNPHPKISLPMPLPLGAECEEDIFAMRIYYPCDENEILNRLNKALPLDIRLKTVKIIKEEKRISQPTKSIYELKTKGGDKNKLIDLCEEFLGMEEIITERTKEKKKKNLNIRPLIENLEIAGDSVIATLLHEKNSAKPTEIFTLFQEKIPGLTLVGIVRKKLLF
ncbi:MAG: TIGR03960 family B12-binding radical SAM protein [Abditibacteriota bacterium]|nr:TIGR03960 family B12-binding radical SAM protein [Abditibacteriota bacterium]